MTMYKRIYGFFVFFAILFYSLLAFGEDIAIYPDSSEIKAFPGKATAFFMNIIIPDGYYIYANPKGPGIGAPTELVPFLPFKTEYLEIRYPEGKEYLSPGDTDHVYIYKRNVRIGVAFIPSKDLKGTGKVVKVHFKALMCGYGACLPIEKDVALSVNFLPKFMESEFSSKEALDEFLSLREGVPVVAKPESKKIVEKETNIAKLREFKFQPVCPERGIRGLIEAILLGIIAGFILNFMPCVLPVVSLKILAFVENAHKSRKKIFMQGLLFSSGIIVSFLGLASLAAFWGYKWGELFQNKYFIVFMTAFVFALALSLFNVYIINAPSFAGKLFSQKRNIYPDAFVKGVIATLLATPCSGPLLGGTLAWASQRPPLEIFAVFIAIGFGMALPYVFLTAYPTLTRYIPKPGQWTVVFEEIMGFFLMLTSVYLIWIADNSFRMNLILFLFFVALAFWQYGKFGGIDKSRRARVISEILLILILAGGFFVSFKIIGVKKELVLEKTPFSTERLLSNKDKGIISVVSFTADWCPNCKFVEKTVLQDERIARLLSMPEVDFMIADITLYNPEADVLLKSFGANSIPFLAIIPPGSAFLKPACLRDIYSKTSVIEAIEYAEKFVKKKGR